MRDKTQVFLDIVDAIVSEIRSANNSTDTSAFQDRITLLKTELVAPDSIQQPPQ